MFVVRPDGLDDEIKFVGTVDLPGHAVVFGWRDDAGFGEVIQPVNSSGRVIFHEEHNAAFAFRPGEQDEMIGAEVEHRSESGKQRPGAIAPAPGRQRR